MNRPRLAFAALAAWIASGCAAIDPYNMIGRQSAGGLAAPVSPVPGPVAAALTAEERARAFDFVWTTIRDRYYDEKLNGVDWRAAGERFRPEAMAAADDEAFWDALDRMTGELRDAHTRVESPRRVELRRRDEAVSLGITFRPMEGRLVLTGVHADADAWYAGARPGMAIVAIDGEPALAAYAKLLEATRRDSTERSRHLRAVRRLTAGEAGTAAVLAFERADGTRFEATLKRRRIATAASEHHRVLPSGFGYLRFTQWTYGMRSRVEGALKELKDTPGLVIDLRGNPGGSLDAVNGVLSAFFTGKTAIGRSLTRTGKPVSVLFGAVELIKLQQEVKGDKEAYTAPVAVLVNAASGSGSEFFSAAMQALGRATIVGEPSCGCLLGFLGYAAVPGGAELAYSEVGFEMANGKRIEGEGVVPDRPVPLSVADLQAGRDRALEEAESVLRAAAAAAKDAGAAKSAHAVAR